MNAEAKRAYISVFYPQSGWKVLFNSITSALSKPDTKASLAYSVIFFSKHRGQSLRLLLGFRDANQHGVLSNVCRDLESVLINNRQCEIVNYPESIEAFFKDFESHGIHYNLFNSTAMFPDVFGQLQIEMSKIMLQFFSRHEVNNSSIFELTLILCNKTLKSMFSDDCHIYRFLDTIAPESEIVAPRCHDALQSPGKNDLCLPEALFSETLNIDQLLEFESDKELWEPWHAIILAQSKVEKDYQIMFKKVAAVIQRQISHLNTALVGSAIKYLKQQYVTFITTGSNDRHRANGTSTNNLRYN